MPRQLFEFSCTNCPKIFDFKLNVGLNGNYRIHCPNCNHIHYRVIENGKITGERFPDNDDKILIEDIRPMKSSCRDESKEVHDDLSNSLQGFLRRSWFEKCSCNVVR